MACLANSTNHRVRNNINTNSIQSFLNTDKEKHFSSGQHDPVTKPGKRHEKKVILTSHWLKKKGIIAKPTTLNPVGSMSLQPFQYHSS